MDLEESLRGREGEGGRRGGGRGREREGEGEGGRGRWSRERVTEGRHHRQKKRSQERKGRRESTNPAARQPFPVHPP
jgi:hypothetical protein